MKCPTCGSSAQPKLIDTDYRENGRTIEKICHYKCGCETNFMTVTVYENTGVEVCSKVSTKNHKRGLTK